MVRHNHCTSPGGDSGYESECTMKTCSVLAWGVGLSLGVIVGCGGGGNDGGQGGGSALSNAPPPAASPPGGGATAAPPGTSTTPTPPPATSASAEVTSTDLSVKTDACTVDAHFPIVKTSDPAVTAAIAKVLPAAQTQDELCKDSSNDFPLDLTDGFELGANSSGMLSMLLIENNFTGGAHFAGLATHTFDLAKGTELKISDILLPAGIDVVKAACIKLLEDPNEGAEDPDSATNHCTLGVGDGAQFVVKDDEFNLLLDLGTAEFAIGIEGAHVKWADLAGKIAPGLASDFVTAHTH
jgi:hypothetical protein